MLSSNKKIKAIRRAGLLIALEFGEKEVCDMVCRTCVENGILTESFLFRESAMRIAPPLVMTEKEIMEACELINMSIDSVV